MNNYDQAFYGSRDRMTRHAAGVVIDHVLELFPGIHSAVDVGCGVGTWLAVLLEKGVGTVRGYDGPWVQANQLVIPRDSFQNIDLGHPEGVRPDRRFDLAICLEVAEHLPPERAGDLVHSLCSLSDIVLFSAAIPGQGGVHHVNEQWPAYWAARFAGLGYKAIDTIRFRIWEDDEIPYWYRQNLVVYAGDGVPRNPTPGVGEWGATPLPLVHPALFEQHARVYAGQALRLLISSLGNALRRRLGRKAGVERPA